MSWYKKSQEDPYMNAVKNEDFEVASKLVHEAAQNSGYIIGPVYHGTDRTFNIFKSIAKQRGRGQVAHDTFNWFSSNRNFARNFGYSSGNILEVFILPGNMWTVSMTDLDEYFHHNAEGSVEKFIERLKQNNVSVIQIDSNKVDEALLEPGATHTVYGVSEPENVKLSNAVTYDDNKEIIPLSMRFNKNNPDMRY